MGRLTYNSNLNVYFDDRTLAHIQAVITRTLENRDSFYLSWKDDPQGGTGRNVIWLHPGVSLYYKFTNSQKATLNFEWLEALAQSADTPDGMTIIPEPYPAHETTLNHGIYPGRWT